MSNEVNITEVAAGTLNPGSWREHYMPTNNYDVSRRKVYFYSVTPDPAVPGVTQGDVGHIDMEITRVFFTVWTGPDFSHVFQRNVRVNNPSSQIGNYHLYEAATDN